MIKVKREHPNAQIPTRNNPTDAGADLYAVDSITIAPQSRALVSTGISIELPKDKDKGLYARIAPRSGLAFKHGIDVLAGVIDNDYRGIIGVVLINTDKDKAFEIKAGDRVAQLIVEAHYNYPFVESGELNNTERSNNGFGSSGT